MRDTDPAFVRIIRRHARPSERGAPEFELGLKACRRRQMIDICNAAGVAVNENIPAEEMRILMGAWLDEGRFDHLVRNEADPQEARIKALEERISRMSEVKEMPLADEVPDDINDLRKIAKSLGVNTFQMGKEALKEAIAEKNREALERLAS